MRAGVASLPDRRQAYGSSAPCQIPAPPMPPPGLCSTAPAPHRPGKARQGIDPGHELRRSCDDRRVKSGEDRGMTMTQHEPGLASGGQPPSGRIDVHAHYVPAELQGSLPDAPVFRGFATWEPRTALEVMDRQGI